MSKADGWNKDSPWEWSKSGETFRASISKVTGNGSHPYMWDVYPLPRKDNLGEDGRYRALRRGSSRTLAKAKAGADETIAKHLAEGDSDV